MKKAIIAMSLLFCLVTTVSAQSKTPADSAGVELPKYSVTLTAPDWIAVLEVIDASSADHLKVKAVQNIITNQVNAQIAEELKKRQPVEIKKEKAKKG